MWDFQLHFSFLFEGQDKQLHLIKQTHQFYSHRRRQQDKLWGLHTFLEVKYLCRYSSQQEPFLLGISPVVDDLAASEAGVAIKHLHGLGLALHAPVVNCIICHKGNSVQRDPLPEGDIVCHGVSLHLALHFDVKDLQRFPS